MRENRLSFWDKVGYGFGNMGFGIIFQVIGAYLVFYATAVMDVPGKLIGLAVSLGVVWDAVTDPVMGYLSDITTFKRYGRRHLYIFWGGILSAISNYILWTVSKNYSVNVKFFWIFTDLILIKTFMTIYGTPYSALGAELSDDYNERTSIQGFKTIFFLTGLAAATVFGMFIFFKPTLKYPIGQLNPKAYMNLGLTASLIMAASSMITYFSTKKYIPFLKKAEKDENKKKSIKNLLNGFRDALKNKDYSSIVYGYLFTNISSAIVSNFGLHVFTYTFKMDNDDIAAIFAVQFIISILSQPAWIYIAKKLDKKRSAILGLFLCILGSAIFMLLVFIKNIVSGIFWYFIPFAILIGFGTGGLVTLPYSMVADTIDLEELKTGKRTEGTYIGCMTLFYKLSQSVTILILGFLLDLVHFNASMPVQTELTNYVLGFTLPVGSLISFSLAIYAYSKYSLNMERVNEVQTMLKSK